MTSRFLGTSILRDWFACSHRPQRRVPASATLEVVGMRCSKDFHVALSSRLWLLRGICPACWVLGCYETCTPHTFLEDCHTKLRLKDIDFFNCFDRLISHRKSAGCHRCYTPNEDVYPHPLDHSRAIPGDTPCMKPFKSHGRHWFTVVAYLVLQLPSLRRVIFPLLGLAENAFPSCPSFATWLGRLVEGEDTVSNLHVLCLLAFQYLGRSYRADVESWEQK